MPPRSGALPALLAFALAAREASALRRGGAAAPRAADDEGVEIPDNCLDVGQCIQRGGKLWRTLDSIQINLTRETCQRSWQPMPLGYVFADAGSYGPTIAKEQPWGTSCLLVGGGGPPLETSLYAHCSTSSARILRRGNTYKPSVCNMRILIVSQFPAGDLPCEDTGYCAVHHGYFWRTLDLTAMQDQSNDFCQLAYQKPPPYWMVPNIGADAHYVATTFPWGTECIVMKGGAFPSAGSASSCNGLTLLEQGDTFMPSGCPAQVLLRSTISTTTTTTTLTGTTTTITATTTTSTNTVQATAYGDPHLVNLLGEAFDVLRSGVHRLLDVSPGSSTKQLYMTALIEPLKHHDPCNDRLFITGVELSGSWLSPLKHLSLSAQTRNFNTPDTFGLGINNGDPTLTVEEFAARTPRAVVNATRYHPVLPKQHKRHVDTLVVRVSVGPGMITVGWAHTQMPSANWLWVQVQGLEEHPGAIGGILGEDSHHRASTPDPACDVGDSGARRPLGPKSKSRRGGDEVVQEEDGSWFDAATERENEKARVAKARAGAGPSA